MGEEQPEAEQPNDNSEISLDSATDVIQLIPQVFTWDRLEDIAKNCLAGATIDDYELDADGFCDLFQEDVAEFYVAIFYAMLANYPKYILPFLDGDEDDSTPDSKK
jgi:hypothetical protein